MAFLVFCSTEIGAWPYAIADLLNRNGVTAYYASVAPFRGDIEPNSHDSTDFHFGVTNQAWNLSGRVHRSALTLRGRISLLGRLARELACTGCFATGSAAFLLRDALPSGYNYWSYGADLDGSCFWPARPSNQERRRPLQWARYLARCVRAAPRVRPSRRSIRAAHAIMIAPYQYPALERVAPGKKLFFLPHIIPADEFEAVLLRKAEAKETLRRRFGAKHIFFSSTRHYWGGARALMADNKGNDIAIQAFALYRHATEPGASKLVLVNKGPSVRDSQELARALGAHDDVAWIEPVPRGELSLYYAGADACLGQFGASILTYSTLEPMAQGTPIASFDDSSSASVPYYSARPVMVNSRVPEELASFLHEVTSNGPKVRDLRERTWRWARDNCSEGRFVESFVDTFTG